jgi:hypothetical protein
MSRPDLSNYEAGLFIEEDSHPCIDQVLGILEDFGVPTALNDVIVKMLERHFKEKTY